jgi:hypothetical protein
MRLGVLLLGAARRPGSIYRSYALRIGEPVKQNRPPGIVVVALLMIAFGMAEVVTGLTHNFFGISTAKVTASVCAGVVIGVLYAAAGLFVLSMRRRAAGLAIILLMADIVGRIAMVATGLYPLGSWKQTFAMILGTSIVAAFAVYIRLKWSSFN